jgi:5'-methylthioadenosine phosphorylase
MAKIGIIGGSGLDDPKLLKDYKEIDVDTPYGKPSSPLTVGKLNGVDVVILARHGKKHSIMPSNVNYRANIWALREQGVTHILATTACGSLREEIKPGTLVLPDQFIDRTHGRHSTFYDKDQVCHIGMAEPFCAKLRDLLEEAMKELGVPYSKNKTLVTINGPRFSTKAESNMFRQWGADVINMSVVPECVLAREMGICYQPIAMSTDYDCWHESKAPVTWDQIVLVVGKNVDNVKKVLLKVLPNIKYPDCDCKGAIKSAMV